MLQRLEDRGREGSSVQIQVIMSMGYWLLKFFWEWKYDFGFIESNKILV